MYNISFCSSDEENNLTVNMEVGFEEQPTWTEITDKFLDFLKSNGYVFDINGKLDITSQPNLWPTSGHDDDKDNLWNDNEPKPKRKAKSKSKPKLSSVKKS